MVDLASLRRFAESCGDAICELTNCYPLLTGRHLAPDPLAGL